MLEHRTPKNSSDFIAILITKFLFGAVTTIDFETDGDGYTASSTEGSGWTDVFNRTNYKRFRL